jgi:hypothetical protein
VTWGKRLYFPSEGRHAEDFFARKIRRLRPRANPRSWVPEASVLTTRPPKPLVFLSTVEQLINSKFRSKWWLSNYLGRRIVPEFAWRGRENPRKPQSGSLSSCWCLKTLFSVEHGELTVVSKHLHTYDTVCTLSFRCYRPRLHYLIVCGNPGCDQGFEPLYENSHRCYTQTAGSTTLATMPVYREPGSKRFSSNYCLY